MRITQRVKKILNQYEGESPAVKLNIARFLSHGRLAGTGKMMVLAVDQGFEHGPDRTFAMNPDAYDPHYHYKLAVDAGLSGYAAPVGSLESGADTYLGAVPTILKINSSNSLMHKDLAPNQAVTSSVSDALRLGCSAIGFTLYPGSDDAFDLIEEYRELALEAKSCGLAVVAWSYARGNVSKPGETSLDVISYGAHMACLLGANIIKVKLPTDHIETKEAQKNIDAEMVKDLHQRVEHVMKCTFDGRRIVIFSGGETKGTDSVLNDAKAIMRGGGHGSIMGRNCFQRPRDEALTMIRDIQNIYLNR